MFDFAEQKAGVGRFTGDGKFERRGSGDGGDRRPAGLLGSFVRDPTPALDAFYGGLGAGKTHFIQGICRGMGVREHVASPTFTIVNEYDALGIKIYHFDFYRIHSIDEILQLGFEEYLSAGGISLIEWAGKAGILLPARRLDIRIELGSDESSRTIVIENVPETSA